MNRIIKWIKNSNISAFAAIFSIIAIVMSCNNSQQNSDVELKNSSTKNAKATEWLSNPDNFYDSTFNEVFIDTYAKTLEDSCIDCAAEVIIVACQTVIKNYSYDSVVLSYSVNFLNKYGNQLDDRLYSEICKNTGCLYSQNADYENSNYYLEQTKKHVVDLETALVRSDALREMIYNNLYTGNFEKALLCGYEALMYDHFTNYKKGEAGTYAGMAGVFSYTGENDKALLYINKVINMVKVSDNPAELYILYTNKTAICYQTGDTVGLMNSIDTLSRIYDKWKPIDERYYIDVMSWKAINSIRLGDKETALNEINQLLSLRDEKKSGEFDFSNLVLAIAEYEKYFDENIIDKSEYIALLPELEMTQQYHLLILYYDLLSKSYFEEGDFENAYLYSKLYNNLEDSLNGLEVKKKLLELEHKYESSQKETELILKDKDLSDKRVVIGLLIAAIVVLVLVSILFVIVIRIRNLNKARLMKENFTRQIFEKAEEERKRIAQDLHDTVGHDLVYIKNLNNNNGELTSGIDNVIQTVRDISRNLHPALFEIIGLEASLEQMISRMQKTSNILINFEIDYNNSLSKSKELQIYRVIQESLTNIIKHSGAEAAKLSISETANHVKILIVDNGCGFDVDKSKESGNAYGLLSIIERSKAVGGTVTINSGTKGTKIQIEILKNENCNNC